MVCSLSLSAKQYCEAEIRGLNHQHQAFLTCKSLGNDLYQIVFESTDAFQSFNQKGSNFYGTVDGVGGVRLADSLKVEGKVLTATFESALVPTYYVATLFFMYEDGEERFDLPIDADFSTTCEGGGDDPDKPEPAPLTPGTCSYKLTEVDKEYTENYGGGLAADYIPNGYTMTFTTKEYGVEVVVVFNDQIVGAANPRLFMLGDEFAEPMMQFDAATMTARYTITGVADGDQLLCLVKLAVPNKDIFTQRMPYEVGFNCDEEEPDLPDGLEQTRVDNTHKQFRNGQLIIYANGRAYNALGQQINQ